MAQEEAGIDGDGDAHGTPPPPPHPHQPTWPCHTLQTVQSKPGAAGWPGRAASDVGPCFPSPTPGHPRVPCMSSSHPTPHPHPHHTAHRQPKPMSLQQQQPPSSLDAIAAIRYVSSPSQPIPPQTTPSQPTQPHSTHHNPPTHPLPPNRYYVDRIVSSIEGMKVLLLDAETTQIISTVYSQVRWRGWVGGWVGGMARETGRRRRRWRWKKKKKKKKRTLTPPTHPPIHTTILEREVYLVERLNPKASHPPTPIIQHLIPTAFSSSIHPPTHPPTNTDNHPRTRGLPGRASQPRCCPRTHDALAGRLLPPPHRSVHPPTHPPTYTDLLFIRTSTHLPNPLTHSSSSEPHRPPPSTCAYIAHPTTHPPTPKQRKTPLFLRKNSLSPNMLNTTSSSPTSVPPTFSARSPRPTNSTASDR